ncbi:Hypp3800 [Branchiostoma lanceolatum]|uniref:Hypp3800 protein n=1 Tax=Branchiostoma lanceolatum TaxID=7740 RepID=A0A8K0EVF5_BRALA|nr:Hypp3800 [Branchiostoma lanceolatum]
MFLEVNENKMRVSSNHLGGLAPQLKRYRSQPTKPLDLTLKPSETLPSHIATLEYFNRKNLHSVETEVHNPLPSRDTINEETALIEWNTKPWHYGVTLAHFSYADEPASHGSRLLPPSTKAPEKLSETDQKTPSTDDTLQTKVVEEDRDIPSSEGRSKEEIVASATKRSFGMAVRDVKFATTPKLICKVLQANQVMFFQDDFAEAAMEMERKSRGA